MERPPITSNDSGSSTDSIEEEPEVQDNTFSNSSYYDSTTNTTPFSSFDGRPPVSTASSTSAPTSTARARFAPDVIDTDVRRGEALLAAGRPQRPGGPARTPSNTYNPPRGPVQRPSHPIALTEKARRGSTAGRSSRRNHNADPNTLYKAQEKTYIQRLRQDQPNEYFESFTPGIIDDIDSDGDPTENESPASDAFGDLDSYNEETLLFYGNDDMQPTEEDLNDPAHRERLEWHGMLASVLTGDVVKQEKKRLIANTETMTNEAIRADMWFGLRSALCGRTPAAQKRMVEESRSKLDPLLNEISTFAVQGESEIGKTASEQVNDVIQKIEKAESLYASRSALMKSNKIAQDPLYVSTCDAVISWQNTQEMINLELLILQNWVGNEELDFVKAKERSPSGNGLSDEASFLDRLLKEDGLKQLYESKTNMLIGINSVVNKAKTTLIENSEAFAKRHLPPYIEELLTLISFPSRLIEQIIRVRVAYARKMKESAQQNIIMQDQMISQFQILLKLAVRIKQEYEKVSQPEAGWDLPPCIDESFDQVVLDALRFYFKMLSWKLTSNKNAFKENEILEMEWEFTNGIGRYLHGGDVEVAEQFSSLTYKAVYRISQSFEKELHKDPVETAPEMERRFKAILDSVRVRQRMLQRFSNKLSDKFENATDFSVTLPRPQLQEFYDNLDASGHFLVDTVGNAHEGVFLYASSALWNRPFDIEAMLGTLGVKDDAVLDTTNPYILIIRPEHPIPWYGRRLNNTHIREPGIDIKLGHLRLIADGSGPRLVNARTTFLDAVNMHLDMIVEQRSNLHKVNNKLTEIKRVTYKLSNTIMDSVEIIRKQGQGLDCQELVHSCFVFATEFGQRSQLFMDRNRRQIITLKLTKLALDWVAFVCDDCAAADRKTFRWAVAALEFSMLMTQGKHILSLGDDEYARLRTKVGACMSLLISHFDIMGARSTLAAQAEKQRMDDVMKRYNRLDGKSLDDEASANYIAETRLAQLLILDEDRKEKEAQRQALGRVLEENNDADRSLTFLSSSATNVTMRWQQGNFVGGGTFGSVYSAINLDSGYLMAVKEIRLQDPQLIPTIAGQIRDEMSVLEVLDHPNVVSYHGIEVHRDKVYIFMEFCSGGSLASLLEHGRIEDEQVILVYALQLLEGLAYLHESGIVHRDIKPDNILLDHSGVIKYVDFGAAKVIARQGKTLVANTVGPSTPGKPAGQKSMTGTPMYMSPEVIKGENSGRAGAVDVWSLGCVILEMATGRRPWASLDNEWAIMYNIAQGNPPSPPTPDQLSPQGIDFVAKCFIRDPKLRASAAELLQHEWIMNIRSQVSIEPQTPSESGSSHSSNSVRGAF